MNIVVPTPAIRPGNRAVIDRMPALPGIVIGVPPFTGYSVSVVLSCPSVKTSSGPYQDRDRNAPG